MNLNQRIQELKKQENPDKITLQQSIAIMQTWGTGHFEAKPGQGANLVL